MDIKVVGNFVRNHLSIIPLSGALVALAILGFVLLSSADEPPVSVEKSADQTEVLYGDHVKYTAVFSNSSASDVYLEVVSDTLPPGFTYLSMGAGSQILDDPTGTTGTIVWDSGPYLVSASGLFTVAYNVRATAAVRPEPYGNLVEARLSTGEIVADTALVQVVGPELDGVKQASPAQVRVGDPVDYSVTLSNDGIVDFQLSSITDTLPAGFKFVQMLSGPLPAPTVQGNKLIWTPGIDLPIGDDVQFSYRVLAYGAVDQAHVNSLQAAFDGQVSDPIEASITVLPFYVHVPSVLRLPAQTPSYRLAFDSKVTEEDGFEIWAVNADGTNRVNVSQNGGGDLDPDWSPDGTHIVWVHYVDGLGDIHMANADGTGETVLSNHAKDERAPAWSPDGTKIVFQRRVDVSGEVPFHLFWLDPANPATKTQLTFGTRQSHDAVWSPDGSTIAYVWGYDQYAEVCVMDVASQATACLTDNSLEDTAPAWSPDGNRLAYVRHEANDSEIYIVEIATQDTFPLTNNNVNDYAPDWSPDGTLIAYSTFMDDSYEVATINVNTFVATNLTNTGAGIGDYSPRWSPDGTLILFLSNRDGPKDMYVMGADGQNPAPFRLTNTTADESIYVWKP